MSQASKNTEGQTIDTAQLDQSSKTQTKHIQYPAPSSADPFKLHNRPSKILKQVAERKPATTTIESSDQASRDPVTGSIPPEAPVAKPSYSLPSPAQINAYAISQLTDRPLRRGSKLYDGRLPDKYKPVARRITYAIVALPIAIVTSYVLYQRLVLDQEQKSGPSTPRAFSSD